MLDCHSCTWPGRKGNRDDRSLALHVGQKSTEGVHTLAHLGGRVSARGTLMLLDVQRATAYSNHNQHSNSSLIRSIQFASRRNRFPPVDSSRQEPLLRARWLFLPLYLAVVSIESPERASIAKEASWLSCVSGGREKTNRIVGRECASCCDAYQSWRYPSLHAGTTVSIISKHHQQSLVVSHLLPLVSRAASFEKLRAGS